MRINAFLMFLVVVAGIFLVFSLSVQEINTQYPDVYINSTEWEDKYDFSNETNQRATTLKDYLDDITDPDRGFFSKLALGIEAIPYAVIAVPAIVLDSLANGISIATSGLGALGIPSEAIILVGIAITLWGVIKLVSLFTRNDL